MILVLRGTNASPIPTAANSVEEATPSVEIISETTDAVKNELLSASELKDRGSGAALFENWTWFKPPTIQKNPHHDLADSERWRKEQKTMKDRR